MFSRLTFTLASALCAGAVLVPAAGAAPRAAASDLFVVNAGDATLAHDGGTKDYTLTLRSPERTVTAFADRPARTASTRSLRGFVSGWAQLGFAADAPNAALVVDGRSTVFTISQPRIGKSGALTLRAHKISGQAAAVTSARVDRTRGSGGASLFIDASAADVPLTIQVSGVPANAVARVSFDTATIDPFGDAKPLETRSLAPSVFTVAGNAVVVVAGQQTLDGSLTTAIDPGGRSLTGNALLPAGATMTITAGTGAPTQVGNGTFSVPLS